MGELTPGPVIADIRCSNQVIDIAGNQGNDQVSSDFKLNLNAKSQYKVDAWLKPEAQFPQSMAEQLHWLGNPTGQGRYPFTFSGRL